MKQRILAGLAALVVALSGCAGARGAGALRDLVHGRPDRAAALARRDPSSAPAQLALSLLARRDLDDAGEARALLAAAAAEPDGPIALVALRRLGELCEASPAIAAQVEEGLAPLLASGRLRGVAAYRARVGRAAAAEVRGDHAAAARLRAENGAVSAWTMAGPFALFHALDFERTIPPELGSIPEEVTAGPGLPPRRPRTLPAPDGTASLDGAPADGDVIALASDVTLATGGDYLLAVTTALSARVRIDGALVHERRAYEGFPPAIVQRPVTLAPGRHRLVAVVARGGGRAGLHVAFSRADGAPSDARFEPAAPGAAAPALAQGSALRVGPPAVDARALAAALEAAAGDPDLAAALAARDVLVSDREAAKALLQARPPSPSALLSLVDAEVIAEDPTLDDRVARARAEAHLREALRLDPGAAEARLRLAQLLRGGDRLDDADELLAGLGAAAGRPAALAARARAAHDRGLAERAEGLAGEAVRAGGSCEAAELLRDLAGRRGDLARVDEALQVLRGCRGGRERLAAELRRRGDPQGAAAAVAPVVEARPWAIEPALALADARLASGDARAAADVLARLASIWSDSPRVLTRWADLLELAGRPEDARATRSAALAQDGGDLALRRALALDASGGEPLDDLAEPTDAAIRAYRAAGPARGGVSATMVLDAAAVEIHPGGSATERTHQVIGVHDQQGVEQWGEVHVPQGARILAIRVLKPDGRVLEPERASADKGSVSLTGLAPGDFIDLEWLQALRGPRGLSGYAASPFYFRVPGARLFRSTYVVRAPAGLGLAADPHRLPPGAGAVAREGGFDVIRAEARDVPALIPEPGAPGGTELLPFLAAGTTGGLEPLQRAVGDAMADRSRVTRELRALADELRAGREGAPPEALVRAAYAAVARRVLGEGSASEDASVILSRGRGNRLSVLKAVLGALGVEARLALVRPFTADPGAWRFPTLALYGTPVLRVRAGGRTWWLDPSSTKNPFGALPGPLLGCEALVVPEPGDALELARLPDAAPVPDGRALAASLTLAPDGGALLAGTDRYTGASAAAWKAALEPLDASTRRQAIEKMLGRTFGGVALTSVAFRGEDDPEAPLELQFTGRVPDLARALDGGQVVEAPLFPARLGARYVQVAARTLPLLVADAERTTQTLTVVAPPGLRPRAGPPQRLEGPFGRYERRDRVTGGTLVREERLEVLRGRIPPERYPDFARFAAAVDQLQEEPLLLER